MRRTEWLQETRLMRFEEAYEGWNVKHYKEHATAGWCGEESPQAWCSPKSA